MLLVRTDGNGEIGAGHIGRCSAVAEAAMALGHDAVFAVTDEESAGIVEGRGFRAVVVGGDYRELHAPDALLLGGLIAESDAVLVDTYGATPGFLSELRRACGEAGLPLGYIDDLFTFGEGRMPEPRMLDVDVLVNYSFGMSREAYETLYAGSDTTLLISPSYAPVASRFAGGRQARAGFPPRSVLVTTGSTNPGGALERMVDGCRAVLPDATIEVVVGARAGYAGAGGARVREHCGIADLSDLMGGCDIAVSAAGTTLYELACMGLPAVAVPVVENQMYNIQGASRSDIAVVIDALDWDVGDVCAAVKALLERGLANMARSMRNVVDGKGAERLARELLA